jgi:hypothetical protein
VIFVEENSDGPGVKLRKSAKADSAKAVPVEDWNSQNDE